MRVDRSILRTPSGVRSTRSTVQQCGFLGADVDVDDGANDAAEILNIRVLDIVRYLTRKQI